MANHADEARKGGKPTLSVVVPIHNVEMYLDECLESIAKQEVPDFEVIMVDDGSTDGSGEIAARWAANDSRYRLLRQANHGLGHARNSGADHASGRYLAFLDSDDLASANAYRVMIDTLDETGSDFATGNVHRFDSSGRTWQAPLYRGMAGNERRATHVSRDRELLRDHLAPNKVWRLSFWKDAGIRFPVGVLYEDVPTVIPLHVRARAVDVVPVVSTLWRVRDQGDSSITQSRHQDARQVRDRVDAVLSSSRYIGEHASQDLKDDYDVLVLRRDLRWYIDMLPELDVAYRAELVASIGRFVEQVSPTALRQTPVAMRVAYELLRSGAGEDLDAFVKLRRADAIRELPVSVRHGRALLDIELPNGTELHDDAVDVTEELRVASRVSDFHVTNRDLVISGWAYIPRLRIERPERHEIGVWLSGSKRSVPAQMRYRRDVRAASDVGALGEATGRVAFTATIPLRKLRRRWRRDAATWIAMVSVTSSGIMSAAPIGKPLVGIAERPVMAPLPRGQWLRVCWNDEYELTCRVRRETAIATDVKVADDGFVITICGEVPVGSDSQFRVRDTRTKEADTVPVIPDPRNNRLGHSRIDPAHLPGLPAAGGGETAADASKAWDLSYRARKGDPWQRVLNVARFSGSSVTDGDAEIIVRQSRAATLRLVRATPAPTLTQAGWRDDAVLALQMDHTGSAVVEGVVLSARRHDEQVIFPATCNQGKIAVELHVGAVPRFGETVPIRAGTWDLEVRTAAGTLPVKIGPGVLAALPASTVAGGREYTLTDRKWHSLALVVDGDLAWVDRGSINQRRLRNDVYPTLRTGVRDAVLYEAYFGKQFSDSPREIFTELRRRGSDLEHIVVVRDQQFNVPDGARAVPYRSREYFQALAQSRYIVPNTHLPACFAKGTGQVVVQTWHGVGTKKIGLDLDTVHFANRAYIDKIRGGEADNWDYLVSPNPFTSPILTRAFSYKGTLLETGVPRNDIFHRPESAALARRVRDRLGIDGDRKIVLYAPTWRDNLHDGPGRYRLDLRFDLYEAARKLGDDYAIVFRKHSNVVDRLPPGKGAVVDASDYPDVQELLLVADILVSDYSTLMCDFANTGRPMVFYTYDLANYRDVLRGFYFDFENEVPGPLIADEVDLVPAILDADRVREEYDTKYQRFSDRFCPWDDGNAAARVVDAVFGGSL